MQFQQQHNANNPMNAPMNAQMNPNMGMPMTVHMNPPISAQYPMQQYIPQQPYMNQGYPQQYYPGPMYYPQKKRSGNDLLEWWKRRPRYQKIIMAVSVLLILLWLIYNYGCSIPIISSICSLMRSIGSIFSPILSVLGL